MKHNRKKNKETFVKYEYVKIGMGLTLSISLRILIGISGIFPLSMVLFASRIYVEFNVNKIFVKRKWKLANSLAMIFIFSIHVGLHPFGGHIYDRLSTVSTVRKWLLLELLQNETHVPSLIK